MFPYNRIWYFINTCLKFPVKIITSSTSCSNTGFKNIFSEHRFKFNCTLWYVSNTSPLCSVKFSTISTTWTLNNFTTFFGFLILVDPQLFQFFIIYCYFSNLFIICTLPLFHYYPLIYIYIYVIFSSFCSPYYFSTCCSVIFSVF